MTVRFFCSIWLNLFLLSCINSQVDRADMVVKPIYRSGPAVLLQHPEQLKNKRIGLVINNASLVGDTHLLDTLIERGVQVTKIFSPEHGFKGTSDAGEAVNHATDAKSNLEIISLYGKNYKPTKEQLDSIDLVIFYLQDVGVRFYTYISTMHYVMEACAENNIDMWVLDVPNPHAHYVDGPVMEKKYTSFLGMHQVPLVYGMTIGEYAQMINGEKWLKDSVQCRLKVIACENYSRDTTIALAERPSPNLPNLTSVLLYPSLGLFEGTTMNAGRGTDAPFQQYGHPDYRDTSYSYVPVAIPGASKNPKHKNKLCYGKDLRIIPVDSIAGWGKINLRYLLDAYTNTNTDKFFTYGFTAHAGNALLKQQIKDGLTETEIRKSWQPALDSFLLVREKYLIYPE